MFQAIRKRIFGTLKSGRGRNSSRAPRRLRFEGLETREMMAGGPFNMDAFGNLYYNNRAIDSTVQAIAPCTETTEYVLHDDNRLVVENKDGTVAATLQQADAIAGTASNGVFTLYKGLAQWQNADGACRNLYGNVQSIVATGGNSVFELKTNGCLYLLNSDGTYQLLDSAAQMIVGTGSNAVFCLHSDASVRMVHADGTYKILDHHVQTIAADNVNSVFDLHPDGSLYSLYADGSRYQLDTNVQTVVGSANAVGGAYVLHTNGMLYLEWNGCQNPTPLDSAVEMIVGAGGAVYDLHADGSLYLQDCYPGYTLIDTGVKTIAGTNGTTVFALHGDYSLAGQLYADNGYTHRHVDSNVQQIASAGDLSVFDLHTDGRLETVGGGGGAHLVRGSQQAIAGTGGESVFTLQTDGNLYQYREYQDGLTLLDGNVQSIAGTGSLVTFVLQNDTNLFLQTSANTWWQLDGNVAQIAGTNGFSVFARQRDENLFLQTACANDWWWLDSNVRTIAGTGGLNVFVLHDDNTLYLQTSRVGQCGLLYRYAQDITGTGALSIIVTPTSSSHQKPFIQTAWGDRFAVWQR